MENANIVRTVGTPNAAPVMSESMETALSRIQQDVEAQKKYAKKRKNYAFIQMIATLLLVAVICYVLFSVMPSVNSAINKLDSVAAQLEQVDFVAMSQGVTNLTVAGADGIETALKELDVALLQVQKAIAVIEKLDIEGLNASIADLGAVLEPIARFFGR